MKNNIIKSALMVCIIAGLASCKKDERALDLTVTPVSNLETPDDGSSIRLEPATGANIVFKWSPATTPDGGVILYEVSFDKTGGDFSHPVFKVLSDGGGLQTQASVSQKDLNKIAALAGIEASSAGEIKWTVLATKATNGVLSPQSRKLAVERPAGFAVLPESLYITGTATETGDDITQAIPLNKTADGTFELYTSLKAGSYLLVDQPNASARQFYVDANNIIKEGNTPVDVTGDTKTYRLNYDFNAALAGRKVIDSISLYMSAYNTSIGTLGYIGNSTWEASKIPVSFYPFSWGRDERYKFILHSPAGDEYWGSSNANNVSPVGQPASYFYLFPVSNAQWDNTYKFTPAADGANIKADVYFKGGSYSHVITVL